jgi:hypothetical protein
MAEHVHRRRPEAQVPATDELERIIQAFAGRPDLSLLSKLDALTDIDRIRDPRVVLFRLDVLTNQRELVEVRLHVLKRLQNQSFADGLREAVATTILRLVQDGCQPELRLHAALALAEFTDIDGVPSALAGVVLNQDLPLDIRYSAFTSLERTGPTLECVALVRDLVNDDAFGTSARSLLSVWRNRRTRVTTRDQVRGDSMLVANTSSSAAAPRVQLDRSSTEKAELLRAALWWTAGAFFAFVVPLAVVLAAIVVSSYGIPLPIEVKVP